MSSSIWTQCAGTSEIRRLALRAVRVVEAQHHISTRRLVDDLEEQALLERLIDSVKPAVPQQIAEQSLHYLLSTPFRHAPLRRGTRLGTKNEPGIWYGSTSLHTAFCEVAYYRLLFLEGTLAPLTAVQVDLSAFWVKVESSSGVDLTAPPFARFAKRISSKTSYKSSQPLGAALRAEGVVVALFESARDPERGANMALFSPAFTKRGVHSLATWRCHASKAEVEFHALGEVEPQAHRYGRELFTVGGKLPSFDLSP